MHLRREPIHRVVAVLSAIGVRDGIVARFPYGGNASMNSLCDYAADWPGF